MAVSLNGRRIEAAVFDLDGTLTDSLDSYFEVFREVVASVGVNVLREDVLEPMSTGSYIWDRAIPFDIPEREEKVKQCMRDIPAVFERTFRATPLHPGAAPLLRFLQRQGVVMGIVTSSWRAALAPLEREGLLDLFAAVVTIEDGFPHKPCPEGILHCLERLSTSGAEAVVVGDSPLDLRAGRACEATIVGVLSGIGSRVQLEAESPDFLVDSVADLHEMLERGDR